VAPRSQFCKRSDAGGADDFPVSRNTGETEEKIMNKPTFAGPIYLAILLSLVALLVGGTALAQEAVTAPGRNVLSAPQQQGPTDPAELEAFLDDLIAEQMAEYHIAGATVSVVKDGELFFAKGYGYADLEKQTPVVPDQTLFSVGSLSKLFTWTAVMQLVEQGKVDLHTDVNTYLKEAQIPATFPEPVTLAHLMTHTAGFEELATARFPLDVGLVLPLDEYIDEQRPARVRPPGTTLGYSNYGAALAGFVVQEASGMPYEQYVEDNIFGPLGMARSTFRQPVPPALAGDLAVGYAYRKGDYQPHQEWMQGSPGGALATTAADVSRFMIAHLQDGRYEEARILQESTAQEMHRLQFSKHPRADGWTYGFMETVVNGERIIWHSGVIGTFRSALVLVPERNVGLFVSFNGAGVDWRELMRAFVDRYYPAPPAPAVPEPITDSAARSERFAGSYRGTRSNETGWEKWLALVERVSVRSMPNGTLRTVGAGSGGAMQWAPTEDALVFSQIDGSDTLIFQEDREGKIAGFVVASFPFEEYYKLGWYDTPTFSLLWLLVCLLFFLVNVLVWPLQLVKHKRVARDSMSLSTRVAHWVGWGVSALGLFFAIAFLITSVGPHIAHGLPPVTAPLLVIPLIVSVLTAGMVIFAGVSWARRYWSLARRVFYTLVTVASVAFIWWLNVWNLLGWRF
jgi:CubicO group peptidase (beta-lactamase class C family)